MSPSMMRTPLFGDATNKVGTLIIEGDEVRFVTNIGKAVAENDCCAGVAIEVANHHLWLYFRDAIKWF